MSPWAIGGAYGISAGLIIYAVESGLVEEELHAPLVLIWAVAGLLLAVVGAWRRRSST